MLQTRSQLTTHCSRLSANIFCEFRFERIRALAKDELPASQDVAHLRLDRGDLSLVYGPRIHGDDLGIMDVSIGPSRHVVGRRGVTQVVDAQRLEVLRDARTEASGRPVGDVHVRVW